MRRDAPTACSGGVGRSSTRAAMRPSIVDVELGVGGGSISMKMHSPGHASAAWMTSLRRGAPAPRPGCRSRPGSLSDRAVLGHVGDAVLELHEHVRAVVDAQPVAGAQVLVDPHAHGRRRTVLRSGYRAASAMTEAVSPPVAPTQAPHLASSDRGRRRPLRLVARPRRPRHDRLPDGRERLRRRVVRRSRRARRRAVRGDQVAGPGDRRRRCRCRTAPGGTSARTDRGPVVPDPLPWPHGRHGHRRADPRPERRGRRPRLLRRRRVRRVSPDHSLLAWSSDIDGDEHYTLRVRDLGHRRRPAPTS